MVRAIDLLQSESQLLSGPVPAQQAVSGSPTGNGPLVLIVGEDSRLLEEIAATVRDMGYAVGKAATAQEALRFASLHPPRIVLSDIVMREMDGFRLRDEMRRDSQLSDVPFVFVSNSQHPDTLRSVASGGDQFVLSPIDKDDLRAKLQAALFRQASGDRRPVGASEPAPPSVSAIEREAQRIWDKALAPSFSPATDVPAQSDTRPAESARAVSATAPASQSPSTVAHDVTSADEIYQECYMFVANAIESVRSTETFDIHGCDRLAASLVDAVLGESHLLLKALSAGQEFDLAAHCVNVAIFSIKIGRGLKYERDELVRLAMAALVHDIGMSKIPEELLAKEGSFTIDEVEIIKAHPGDGKAAINALGPEWDWLAEIVYQEHERENGSGYPQGLRGQDIDERAKIIGVADIYEAFSHPRTFRKTFVAHEALQKVIGLKDEFFDARIIRALLQEISMFPLGSYVRLNTGEIAKVTATDAGNLLRPTVLVLYDPTGRRHAKPAVIDLQQTPMLYISEPVYEEDLPDWQANVQESQPSEASPEEKPVGKIL